jgi:hypothetical protein
MPRHLVLQILGNNDIQFKGKEGVEELRACHNLDDIEEQFIYIEQELSENPELVKFPLIEQVYKTQPEGVEYIFVPILTQQEDWFKEKLKCGEDSSAIITSDGIWWKTVLLDWCSRHGIICHPLILRVSPSHTDGAADWNGMAEVIDTLLNQQVSKKSNQLVFHVENKTISIDHITVQHNSGTPALSSALYLWGLEQKLAGWAVDFIYISVQASTIHPHGGEHWRWRLKVPQVQQLLSLQDFSGALGLLQGYPDSALLDQLGVLDRAVSFNIAALDARLTPDQNIIERMAIALWSEYSFRQRRHWMHWFLRVAGAIELALMCLVKRQGNGQFEWRRMDDRLLLFHLPTNTGVTKSIQVVVEKLLSNGAYTFTHRPQFGEARTITWTVDQANNSPQWQDFQRFYYGNRWNINGKNYSFLHLRNNLYHSLMGDPIDSRLDAVTDTLRSVDHPDHPAHEAVGQLRYIIQLADLKTAVNERVQHYRNQAADVQRKLQ